MPALVTDLLQIHPVARTLNGALRHLLLRRAPDEPLCPSIWQVVTGRLEEGESTIDGARRELAEELGYLPDEIEVLEEPALFYFAPLDQMMVSPVVVARFDVAIEPRLSDEHDAWRWGSAEEALESLAFESQRAAVRRLEELAARRQRPGGRG